VVAAHSFTAGDLLRMERVLLDALGFSITGPTAYTFLHLLTQVRAAAARGTTAWTSRTPASMCCRMRGACTRLDTCLHACRLPWRLALRV